MYVLLCILQKNTAQRTPLSSTTLLGVSDSWVYNSPQCEGAYIVFDLSIIPRPTISRN